MLCREANGFLMGGEFRLADGLKAKCAVWRIVICHGLARGAGDSCRLIRFMSYCLRSVRNFRMP